MVGCIRHDWRFGAVAKSMFAGVSSNSEKAPKAAGCGPMIQKD